jgi:hypothetical protein
VRALSFNKECQSLWLYATINNRYVIIPDREYANLEHGLRHQGAPKAPEGAPPEGENA